VAIDPKKHRWVRRDQIGSGCERDSGYKNQIVPALGRHSGGVHFLRLNDHRIGRQQPRSFASKPCSRRRSCRAGTLSRAQKGRQPKTEIPIWILLLPPSHLCPRLLAQASLNQTPYSAQPRSHCNAICLHRRNIRTTASPQTESAVTSLRSLTLVLPWARRPTWLRCRPLHWV